MRASQPLDVGSCQKLPFDLSLGNVRNVPVGDDTGLLDPAISVSDREENRLANRLLAMA